jgi:hypothetical protein
MIDPKTISKDFELFSDPATPFSCITKQDRSLVKLVRYGQEREYFVDLKTERVQGRHNKRDHLNLRSLFASEEFTDLRTFSATQRRILAPKKLQDLIDPAGVIDPDAQHRKLTLTEGRHLISPAENGEGLKILLIDGPAGVGKTSFIERMVFERTAELGLPPIFHITSKGRRLSNLPDAMGKTASDLQADFRADQVPLLVRLGALQVAIDGFDELVQPDGYGTAWTALEDFIRAVGKGGPLVLAGRDTFFDQQDVRKRLDRFGLKIGLTVLRLHEVGEQAARGWLERKGWNTKELNSRRSKGFFRRPYTRRPFFLSQIAPYKSFDALPIERGSPQAILIDELVEREAKVLAAGVSSASTETIKSALITLLEEMAADMADREADSIPREFLEFCCEIAFNGLVNADELGAIRHKVGSVALIETNESRGDLRFPHSEVQNHFHARAVLRALAVQRTLNSLRNGIFSTDLVEAFADASRVAPKAEYDKALGMLLRLLGDEPFAIRLVSNVTALVIASLVRGDETAFPVTLKEVATNEARVFDELSVSTFLEVSIGRLDARGADLSNITFEKCLIGALIADDTTRFGATVPEIGTLQLDEAAGLISEHSREKINEWLRTHSSAFSATDLSNWQRGRDLPLVRYFDRICRRFIRQHYIRDTETDEGSSLLRHKYWPEVFEILKEADRIEVDTSRGAAPAGRQAHFYHVVKPDTLLVPDPKSDKQSVTIRLAVIKRAEGLAGASGGT